MAQFLPHDVRLNNLKNGQYRVWHDGQEILIPRGQSTTNPLSQELVNANTKVYGVINNSYFNPPDVDFVSTNVSVKRFDTYKLQIWRGWDNLPIENPNISYVFDMGLRRIYTLMYIEITCGEFTGIHYSKPYFAYDDGPRGAEQWITDTMHFNYPGLSGLRGSFFLACNPHGVIDYMSLANKAFDTTSYIQKTRLPITLMLHDAWIFNGNSQMQIDLKNPGWNITFDVSASIMGGE